MKNSLSDIDWGVTCFTFRLSQSLSLKTARGRVVTVVATNCHPA